MNPIIRLACDGLKPAEIADRLNCSIRDVLRTLEGKPKQPAQRTEDYNAYLPSPEEIRRKCEELRAQRRINAFSEEE